MNFCFFFNEQCLDMILKATLLFSISVFLFIGSAL